MAVERLMVLVLVLVRVRVRVLVLGPPHPQPPTLNAPSTAYVVSLVSLPFVANKQKSWMRVFPTLNETSFV